MPDVTRSDSQRSDTSLRPRVSFNRDVHVKRIVPREGARTVVVGGALSRDGNGHFVTAPIRKERPTNKSRKELAEEAAEVINQADKLNCITQPKGVSPERFYTLPVRRRNKQNYQNLSLDRKRGKRINTELNSTVPVKIPEHTVSTSKTSKHNQQRASIFDIFKKKTDSKKSNLKRSNSDASNIKSNTYRRPQSEPILSSSDCEISTSSRNKKKQLSPIIEITQREDYFASTTANSDKENNGNTENVEEEPQPKSITETLKEYIDEVDAELYRDNKLKKDNSNNVDIVIIDVDKAEKISPKRSKLKNIGTKWKSITNKNASNEEFSNLKSKRTTKKPSKESPEMIHSSQRPAEKLPLTKGRTVDNIARRLDHDTRSPPPPQAKPNVMITPKVGVQHNNNQPFSYTRGLSPDKCQSDENLSKPVIYAQVVCNNDGRNSSGHKQTIHTAFNKKQPNSDSDEGLGNEETSNLVRKYRIEKTFTHFGDDVVDHNLQNGGESPIMPKYRPTGYGYDEKSYSQMMFIDTTVRGRADGMDAKRRESLSEQIENEFETKFNGGRSDLSARRDLLELRINQRIHDKSLNKFTKSGSSSPPLISRTYFGQNPTSKYKKTTYFNENEPKSFDSQISDYQSSPENNKFETSHRRYEEHALKTKNIYKSTPDIYHERFEERTNQENSYHDSLKRDRNRTNFVKTKTDKDRFGDSGIENDIVRRDSSRKKYYYGNESEDEGFASSLLIANERQHTDENNHKRLIKKEYDSDRAYSGDDDNYRQEFRNKDYVSRERNIDDGSHFDPRIDKEFQKDNNGTLKRTDSKPPKPEKKSGLEKMKQLFSRDSKKKKAAAAVAATKHGMVREESLRARYTEYKGSREHVPLKNKNNIDESTTTTLDYEVNNRRRLSTPSPSPTRETREKPDNTAHTNWFKSLDRLSRKKTKKEDKMDESLPPKRPSPNPKNLRFFGDTDMESSDGTSKSTTKPRNGISYKERIRSQSTRDLHQICENPELTKHDSHKSMMNISQTNRDVRGDTKTNLKPPASPSRHLHQHRSNRDLSRSKEDRNRRRKYEISSVESSTEGDSSQQSQRSVVYLHAATVGDIPGPAYLRQSRRTASREELASNSSGRIQPQVKTLSRSFSVLAPWKPRHSYEANNIDYSQQSKPPTTTKYEQKSSRSSSSRKENSSTLKKKAQDSKKSNSNSTLLNRQNHRSNENLSKSRDELKGSSSTLYKKKERLPRENSRYTKDRDDRKISSKSMSVESLNHHRGGGGGDRRNRDISRSISMPKDTEKSAGWFKKKTNRH